MHLDYGLFLIQWILTDHGKTPWDYGLPQFTHRWDLADGNRLLSAEVRRLPNADQASCFDTIVAAVDADPRADPRPATQRRERPRTRGSPRSACDVAELVLAASAASAREWGETGCSRSVARADEEEGEGEVTEAAAEGAAGAAAAALAAVAIHRLVLTELKL